LKIFNLKLVDVVFEYCEKNNVQKQDLFLFIDEVQEINLWQSQVKILYDISKMSIVVTGSSSSVIAQETSKLTGRHKVVNVATLDFVEYCNFYENIIGIKKTSSEMLELYLESGGLPELFFNNINAKFEYVKNAVDASLYRDLLGVFGIRNPEYLKSILQVMADSVTNPLSFNTIANRVGISYDTAKQYVGYLLETPMVSRVYKQGNSKKITKNSNPKYYFNDIGILNYFSKKPKIGHRIENLVFIELQNRVGFSLHENILYFEYVSSFDSKKCEVDFDVDGKLYEVKTSIDKETVIELDKQYDILEKPVTVLCYTKTSDLHSRFALSVDIAKWLVNRDLY
jgi:predicted AAA+ superfamily ATPase